MGCMQPKPETAHVEAVKYTCAMHPQIMKDKPGNCPICGMKLIKKYGQASKGAGIDMNTVLQPVSSSVISSVGTITPQEKSIALNIKASGYIDFDTRTYNNISARYAGRIEKLYVKYAFQEIHRGQRVFDIYSPDIVTAQQELIYLLQNSPQETILLRAAEQKLLLLGLTTAQINHIKDSKKAFYTLPIYSPYEGHVHDKGHDQNGAQSNMGQTDLTNSPLAITEGMYVTKGQTIFNLVNPHQLWAIIKIDNRDVASLKLHQPVSIMLPDLHGKIINGRVDFIEPMFQNGDKATSVRVYLHNMDHELKVNSLVNAIIYTSIRHGLWIPRSAMLTLGQNKIVWLKQGNSFKVLQVQTGLINSDSIMVTKGLTLQDTIIRDAQYLTDSESFIKLKAHDNQ